MSKSSMGRVRRRLARNQPGPKPKAYEEEQVYGYGLADVKPAAPMVRLFVSVMLDVVARRGP